MKKLLGGIVLFSACAYGMENKNGMLSNAVSLENKDSTYITLKSNDDSQEMLDKEFLPEAWYRNLGEYKLAQEYDQAGNPLITLKNVSSEVLPLVKDALYFMKFLLLAGSEHKATKLAYKNFQALNLSLDKITALLVVLDYLSVPKVLLAGLAKLFVQLTKGEESNLAFLSNEIRKEINRYFYLFYNKEIEGEPQGDRHLYDLLKFDKLDKSVLLSRDNSELYLNKQKLASVCSMSKLIKLGIIVTQLRYLDLYNNQLKEVPPNLVQHCPQLSILSLSNNQLREVPAGLLNNCPQLKTLRLSDNQLQKVPATLVSKCPELQSLVLFNNQLQEVPAGLLNNCPHLLELDLNNNQLEKVPADLLKHCYQLSVLRLGDNRLEEVLANLVGNCSNLKRLDLAHNLLKEVPVDLVRNCSQLQSLVLFNNQLKEVPADLLKHCPRLEDIWLSANQLEEVPEGMLKHCPNLWLLHLNNNQLQAIPADLVSNCPLLQYLYLNANQLKEIPANLLSQCPKLNILNLANNQLKLLPIASLERLKSIKDLYLMNNPLKIDIEALPPFLQQAMKSAEACNRRVQEIKRKMEEQKSEEKDYKKVRFTEGEDHNKAS